MIVDFKWEQVKFEEELKTQMEQRFKDDFGTLLPEETKEVTVIFQEYFPAIHLQGVVIDKKQTELFKFICEISNNHTTTYTDNKNNKITKKNKT